MQWSLDASLAFKMYLVDLDRFLKVWREVPLGVTLDDPQIHPRDTSTWVRKKTTTQTILERTRHPPMPRTRLLRIREKKSLTLVDSSGKCILDVTSVQSRFKRTSAWLGAGGPHMLVSQTWLAQTSSNSMVSPA